MYSAVGEAGAGVRGSICVTFYGIYYTMWSCLSPFGYCVCNAAIYFLPGESPKLLTSGQTNDRREISPPITEM